MIIAAIFSERVNKGQWFDTREVSTYSIEESATKVAVNFLDGIELLDKVADFHCAASMVEKLK